MKNCENQIYYICLISDKSVNFFARSSFKDQLLYMEKFYKNEIVKTRKTVSFDIFSVFRKRELFHGQYFKDVDISKIGTPLFISNSMRQKYKYMDATIFDKSSFKKLLIATKTKIMPRIFNNINWNKDKIIIFRNCY